MRVRVSVCVCACGTCSACSSRDTRKAAGGSSPGDRVSLIESKASEKRPLSIMVPTLLKSASAACGGGQEVD